jgi:hypothetical protein
MQGCTCTYQHHSKRPPKKSFPQTPSLLLPPSKRPELGMADSPRLASVHHLTMQIHLKTPNIDPAPLSHHYLLV